MKCPICSCEMATGMEHTGPNWFSGSFCCLNHGVMRVTGRILKDGRRDPGVWMPRCLDHGFEPIVQVAPDHWRCTRCEGEIRLILGGFMRFMPVTLVGGKRALAVL